MIDICFAMIRVGATSQDSHKDTVSSYRCPELWDNRWSFLASAEPPLRVITAGPPAPNFKQRQPHPSDWVPSKKHTGRGYGFFSRGRGFRDDLREANQLRL